MDIAELIKIVQSAGFSPVDVTPSVTQETLTLGQRADYLRKRLKLGAKRRHNNKHVVILEFNELTRQLLPPTSVTQGLIATMYMDSARELRGVFQWTKAPAIFAYLHRQTCCFGEDKQQCGRPGVHILCEICGFTACSECCTSSPQCPRCPQQERMIFQTSGNLDVSIIKGKDEVEADTYIFHRRSINDINEHKMESADAEMKNYVPIRVLLHPSIPSAIRTRIGTGPNLLRDTVIQVYLARPLRKIDVAVITAKNGERLGQTGFFTDVSSTVNFLRQKDSLHYTTDTIQRAVEDRSTRDPGNSFVVAVVTWNSGSDTGVSLFSIHEIAPQYLLVTNGWVCANCSKSVARKLCSRCKVFRFCSDSCASAYWPKHKKLCKELALDINVAYRTQVEA